MSAVTRRSGSRTFRSGPYLRQLLHQAELIDAHQQRAICARIKQARTEAGYTQPEMADLLGLTLRGYQNYEADRVPFRSIERIAELTNVSPEWLLRGEPVTAPEQGRLERLEGRVEELHEAVGGIRQMLLELRGELLPPG